MVNGSYCKNKYFVSFTGEYTPDSLSLAELDPRYVEQTELYSHGILSQEDMRTYYLNYTILSQEVKGQEITIISKDPFS